MQKVRRFRALLVRSNRPHRLLCRAAHKNRRPRSYLDRRKLNTVKWIERLSLVGSVMTEVWRHYRYQVRVNRASKVISSKSKNLRNAPVALSAK